MDKGIHIIVIVEMGIKFRESIFITGNRKCFYF